MAENYLIAYLNDHLAGSVVALDLLAELEETHAGKEVARTLAELRTDIEADRRALQELMKELDIAESRPRKALAWSTAKLTEVKLRLEDNPEGPLRLLESVEAVALGIEGKLALWRSLSAAAEIAPHLRRIDYEWLADRAEEQRRRAEQVRLSAARAALT
jgi:hypothetical protein